jgi:hypothetical protein
MSESPKSIVWLIAVVVMLMLWSDPQSASANHCPSSRCCGKTFPKVPPPAGFAHTCVWKDGCHHNCDRAKVKFETVKHRFNECREAAQWANGTVAETEPNFSPPKLSRVKVISNADGTYTASTVVTWTLDRENTVIKLPSVNWPNMTDAEKKAVQNFHEAVRIHEVGHITVAEMIVRDPYGSHAGEVKSDPASTRDSAIVNLQRKVDDLQSSAQAAIDQVAGDGGEYDTATDHGRRQSHGPPKFPGGPDIKLSCP